MLKIRNRIALLYSLLTIVLIIICIILFYCFLKININRQPIISSLIFNKNLPVPVETVTAKKRSKNLNASDIIISKTGQKNINNNSNADNIGNSNSSIIRV